MRFSTIIHLLLIRKKIQFLNKNFLRLEYFFLAIYKTLKFLKILTLKILYKGVPWIKTRREGKLRSYML